MPNNSLIILKYMDDILIYEVGSYLFSLTETEIEDITCYVLGYYLYCNYPKLFNYIKLRLHGLSF